MAVLGPSNIPVTAGSGTPVGSFSATRNGTTEQIQATLPLEWVFTVVTPTNYASPVVCLGLAGNAARYVVGLQNLSVSTQPLTITGYDNASAASGQVVFAILNLLPSPSGLIEFPTPGIPLTTGLTVSVSGGVPLDAGIMVKVR